MAWKRLQADRDTASDKQTNKKIQTDKQTNKKIQTDNQTTRQTDTSFQHGISSMTKNNKAALINY